MFHERPADERSCGAPSRLVPTMPLGARSGDGESIVSADGGAELE